MNCKIVMAAFVAAIALSACSTSSRNEMVAKYDPNALAWSHAIGANAIEGKAVSGQLVSTGGTRVDLLPFSGYTSDLITYAYGNTTGGAEIRDIAPRVSPLFRANDIKTVFCNVDGEFQFEHVAEGDYFLIASLTWKGLLGENRNKHVMKRVNVTSGETVQVIITD